MKDNFWTGREHVIFLGAIFCFWFATYIYVPTFSVYLERINLIYSEIGVILGAYGITQILLRWPLGVLLEWMSGNKKKWLLLGFIIGTISGVILAVSATFSMVLIGRLLAGVTASMWVMATIMYGQNFPLSKSTQAMSTMQFMTVFTQFVSMLLCSALISWYGWDFPFWAASVFSLIGALLLLAVPEMKSGAEKGERTIRQIFMKTLGMREVWGISGLSLFAYAILFITIFGFSPLYIVEQGHSESAITWLVVAFFLPHMLTSLSLAYIPLREGSGLRLVFGSFLLSAVFLAVLPTASFAGFLILHAGTGFALGMILPLLLGRAAALGKEGDGMAVMGMFQSLYAIGIFAGPYVSGKLAEGAGLTAPFYFAAALAVTGALLTMVMKKWFS
ncbi:MULTISPECIES: MFS transporter [Salimicrobium]|uniref:MFS transporter n=1 Tax=Salimicrobium humidisoli TaxID=2029857 RepID=A0ABX4HR17_9BACI|nr:MULTISPECIES: MFS transporter [Salimicrobium]PBB05677.1 MFS transporter [Salimicrobium humidisoli]